MNYARVTYNQSVAGNRNFSVPFQYLSKDHVLVTVDGVAVPFTWLNPNTVSLNTAPALGAEVDIRRSTSPNDLLVQFTDGSVISENDMSLLSKQSFYLVQESSDLANESNTLAKGAVAAADSATQTANKAAQDAATAVSTANSATSTANTALANANQAVQTANTALNTANNASNASASAVATANSASSAAASAVSTANTANTKADGAVSTANTALTTANKAAQDASTAVKTADTALADAASAVSLANFASVQAEQAQQAATGAATSAESAANDAQVAVATATTLETTVNQVLQDVQAIANGDLTDFAKNSENLSKLTDVAQARANLGLDLVDNVPDLDKPVSTATQAALNTKAEKQHTHSTEEILGLDDALESKSNVGHGHTTADISGLDTALAGRAPLQHGHTIAEVSGLQTALDGKSPTGHTHAWAQITDKPTTFPPTGHAHAISEVSGLQGALDAKLNLSGGAMWGNLAIQKTAPTINFNDTGWGNRHIHCNGGLLGFLNSGGGWSMYNDDAGHLWTGIYGWLHDYFFHNVSNCASSLSNRHNINCYGSGDSIYGMDYELQDYGGRLHFRGVNLLRNCNCNCQCGW